MAKPSRTGSSPKPVTRPLGWGHRSLLAWAIAGWTLASLLGVVLVFHTFQRRVPESAEAPAVEPATPIPTVPPGSLPQEPAPPAVEVTTTSVAVSRPPEPVPSPGVTTPESSDSSDAVIATLLRHAADFTEAGEFDKAIDAYDHALERDPGNTDFQLLRQQVVELRSLVRQGGAPIPLRVQETPTVYVAAVGPNDGGLRPPELGVATRRATQAPEFPGELVIDLWPRLIEPGDPFVLRVRLYNKGNRALELSSLEVVQTLGGRVEGRGLTHRPRVARVNPRDTALLWEQTGSWQEGQESGSVAVSVELANGGTVSKSISW